MPPLIGATLSIHKNWEINHRGDGWRTSPGELADVMLVLQRRGCHNINVVTPSHLVPQIVKAAEPQPISRPELSDSAG